MPVTQIKLARGTGMF